MLASVVCMASWCSCPDMLASLVLVPKHAGQPDARAKTCWPAWCSCQDMLASLVFVPRLVLVQRHAGRPVLVPRHAWWSCQDMLASPVLQPAWCSCQDMRAWCSCKGIQPPWCLCQDLRPRAKTCGHLLLVSGCSCQSRAASLVLVPRHAARPAWCSCQDNLAKPGARAKTCGQPGVRQHMLEPRFVPRSAASLVRVPGHAGQPGVRAKKAGRPQDMPARAKTSGQPGADSKTCGQPSARAKTRCGARAKTRWARLVFVASWWSCSAGQPPRHAASLDRAKTFGQPSVRAKTRSQPGLLFVPEPGHAASLVLVPRHAASLVLLSRAVLVTRHTGQPGVRASLMVWCSWVRPAWCACHDMQPGVRAKTCWPA